MIGYTTLDKSMNGIKTVSDGKSIISDGNMVVNNIEAKDIKATNVVSQTLTGTLLTSSQPNISIIGALQNLDVSGYLNVLGYSTLKSVTSDSIIQTSGSSLTQSGLGRIVQSGVVQGNLNIMAGMSLNNNSDIYMSGTGKISQSGTDSNTMKAINMTSNSNLSMLGTGIISQSGSSTNGFKASNFIGRVGFNGDLVQTSGANTFFDTNITNITQGVGSTIIQATGQGVSVNAFNKTTVTDLIVTNSLIIPSNVTMPSSTYNGDLNFIGTAKIEQGGSSGVNNFNSSTFNGDINVTGNFNMINGAATSNIKKPTILGLTTMEGIVQTSGTSALRSTSVNQLDINTNYNMYMSGSSIINQSSGIGNNLLKASIVSGLLTTQAGINCTAGQVLLLTNTTFPSAPGGSQQMGLQLYYNVDFGLGSSSFVNGSGSGNGGFFFYTHGYYVARQLLFYATRTQFNIQNLNLVTSGLINNVNPTELSYIIGLTSNVQGQLNTLQNKTLNLSTVNGISAYNGTVNNILASVFQYLDPTSSIQTQLNTLFSLGNTTTAIADSLTIKTTDLTYSSGTSTFANKLNVNGKLTASEFAAEGYGTFPITNTGQERGLAIHWNNSGNTGEVNYLCRGQQGLGGHRFHIARSSSAPFIVLDISPTLTTIYTNLQLNGTLNGISTTIIGYLSGLSSNVQSQLNTLKTQTTDITNASNITTFNGNVAIASNRTLTFNTSTSQKIVLHPSTTLFNNYMIAIEPSTIRYNTDFGGAHLFSCPNTYPTGTSFNDFVKMTAALTTIYTPATFNNNVTIAAGKTLTFAPSYPDRKIILYDNNPANLYSFFGFNVDNHTGSEGANLRINVTNASNTHTFSYGNDAKTGYTDTLRVNSTSLTALVPTILNNGLNVTGASIFNTSLNSITPTTFAFLNGVTSDIQYQINRLDSLGTDSSNNIFDLFVKTTDISYSNNITTIANQLQVNGNLEVASGKVISFDGTTNAQKIIFTTSQYSPYKNNAIGMNGNQMMYNIDNGGSHNFTKQNATSNGYTSLVRITDADNIFSTPTFFNNETTTSSAMTANGNIFLGSNSRVRFFNEIGKKLIFYENQNNPYNAYMLNMESGCTRFNVNENTSVFKFSSANANSNATGFTDMMTLTGSGAVLSGNLTLSSTKKITTSAVESVAGTDLNITGTSGVVKINASTYTMFGGGTCLIQNSGDVLAKSFVENTGTTLINSSGINCMAGTNLETLTVNNNVFLNGYSKLKFLGYYGQRGAEIIDGVNLYAIGMPIFNSIPDFRNFHSRQGSNASGYVITSGSIYTTPIDMNDRADMFLIYPGFRLVVYSEFNYTSVILDITNAGSMPFHAVPTILNVASSAKLYFNGVEV